MPNYFSAELPVKKARKRHICDWCGEAILPGQPYTKLAGRHFDGFTAAKLHPECLAVLPDEEWEPRVNNRGCDCGNDEHCEKCRKRDRECLA